ncbi:MAG: type II secretion system F family protein [Clostridiales Family XIII bacterium]|jgi:hypothetical protein|nr:type II secretion system F family protein [Clostridiales Family XIII bacterium]
MKIDFNSFAKGAGRGARPAAGPGKASSARLGARLVKLIPQTLTGSADEMERRLQAAFGNRDFREQAEAVRRRNATYWFACTALLILLLAAFAAELAAGGAPIAPVERPTYPADPLRVSAAVEAVYGDASVKRRVELTVRPKALDEREKRARVAETARRLPHLILGQNESLSAVVSDLNLIEFDDETGVVISWASENPALIDDDGVLNSVVGRAGDALELKARLVLEDVSEEAEIKAVLGGPVSDTALAVGVAGVLKETVEAINASAEDDALVLPDADAYGVRYRWADGAADMHIPEFTALAVFGLFLYRSRYSWIDKRIKAARRSMIADFPEFIDKLLLMLNAGLVVSEAISRIAADYERRRDEGKPRPLYEELAAIRQRVENTNASLSVELNRMAARSGVRELMRFASVVSDNIDKGSALADKLKAEGELVWKMRKKDAEEAGRLAETKMILPMTLTLLTLIMITMAPAVLDMR